MLKISNLRAGYGMINVLWDVNFRVDAGEVVAILGSNGAGKTTIAKTISGLIKPRAGSIEFDGKEMAGLNNVKYAEAGIVQVPEGRQLFTGMSVYENLELSCFSKESKEKMKENLEIVYSYFPILKERTNQAAGTLSGGEQQMLAVSRGILSMPKVMIIDEPSLGLAPNLVTDILNVARKLAKEEGKHIILIEQDVKKALKVSDRGYVVENGSVVLEESSQNLMNNENVKKAYLGF